MSCHLSVQSQHSQQHIDRMTMVPTITRRAAVPNTAIRMITKVGKTGVEVSGGLLVVMVDVADDDGQRNRLHAAVHHM